MLPGMTSGGCMGAAMAVSLVWRSGGCIVEEEVLRSGEVDVGREVVSVLKQKSERSATQAAADQRCLEVKSMAYLRVNRTRDRALVRRR